MGGLPFQLWNWRWWLLAMLSILAACAQPTPIVQTVVVTSPPTVQVVTPTPSPAPPPVLVLCYGQEPKSLYLYSGRLNLTAWNLLQLLYDGPIDRVNSQDVPVLFERRPSLENGDARIQQVTVRLGDPIVDAWGHVVRLQAGVTYRPSGCATEACARTLGPEEESAVMDQMVVRFRLRKDVRWSDGTPVTARDSVYSFHAARSKTGTPLNPWLLERTASYRAVDEHTVEWTGLPGFLSNTYWRNFWIPLPAHRLENVPPERAVEQRFVHRQPLGWGAYRLVSWEPGSMVFEPNPHYFRKDEGLPYYAQVVVHFFEDPEEALAALMVGECDFVSETVGLEQQARLLFALSRKKEVQVYLAPGPALEHLGFVLYNQTLDNGLNYRDPSSPFSDPRVRKAAAMCIHREAIIQQVYGGFVRAYDTFLPPDHPLHVKEGLPHYPYDPEKARKLLEEAGWVDHDKDPTTPRVFRGRSLWVRPGTPLRVTLATTQAPLRIQAAERIRQDLKQCGFEVEIQTWKPAEFFAPGPEGPVFGRRVDMALFGWALAPEVLCHLWMTEAIPGPPEATIGDVLWLRRVWPREAHDRKAFLYDWAGWNYHAYSNPEFDRACRTVLLNPLERPAAQEALRFLQIQFMRDLPMVPLYTRMSMVVTRPELCGYTPDSSSPLELRDVETFRPCPEKTPQEADQGK